MFILEICKGDNFIYAVYADCLVDLNIYVYMCGRLGKTLADRMDRVKSV